MYVYYKLYFRFVKLYVTENEQIARLADAFRYIIMKT